ncbi:copper-binding protein [Kordiimonas sp.]|uniref:copper-binding protein n=1 Tax=Kordiimonas sp. TaxID=1970157 RepID=UPI003A94B16C
MRKILKAPLMALTIIGLSSLVAHASEDDHKHKSHQAPHGDMEEVMVHAKVNSVNIAERTLNVSHGPIKKLHWPAMTMDMKVADDIDIASLDPGQEVMMALARGEDGIFRVTKTMMH